MHYFSRQLTDKKIIQQKGMNRMDTQRIVLETEEKEFIETVISFVTEKGWTISNLQNAVSKVEDYMKKKCHINRADNWHASSN